MVHSSNKILHDNEFGDIEIRRVNSSYIRLKIQPNGKLIAQLPRFVSPREIEKLVNKSREKLRANLSEISSQKTYKNGDKIGKSHTLHLKIGVRDHIELKGLNVNVIFRKETSIAQRNQLIKSGVAKALRKEAKAYLPRQLKYLAMQNSFKYERVRFTHAKSRWGSCSSNGTISLNIMLMTLPNELIDYVLLHELNHLKHMNHSRDFWEDLEKICPNAKRKRIFLKQFSPYL